MPTEQYASGPYEDAANAYVLFAAQQTPVTLGWQTLPSHPNQESQTGTSDVRVTAPALQVATLVEVPWENVFETGDDAPSESQGTE